MLKFTILGAGWLGLKLAKNLQNKYEIILSSRSLNKINLYKDIGFKSYVFNENNLENLDKLLDTNYLFINFPPSKFNNYLNFLNTIYSNKNILNIKKIIFISSTSIYENSHGTFNEENKIINPKSKIIYEAEKIVKDKTNIILRLSALVGYDRFFGKSSKNKTIDYKLNPINFVHVNDVIKATNFLIENNIDGLFNLCSSCHPCKKDIYEFNEKKYNIDNFIFTLNENIINRIIDGSKISRYGFVYDYENPLC